MLSVIHFMIMNFQYSRNKNGMQETELYVCDLCQHSM